MSLHWLLLFCAVIVLGLVAWHSKHFSVPTLKKIFDRREYDQADEVLGLDAQSTPVILTLNIKAPEGEAFAGDALSSLLRDVGMYFGELNIFHYEIEKEGDYFPVFSLASAFEPGYFDMDNIHEYATPGLSLFMEATRQDAPREIFDLMLNTGKVLADKLGGVLCDDQWQPLSLNAIDKYYAKLGD